MVEVLDRFPEKDDTLKPCPFCGGEVQWSSPTHLMCTSLRDPSCGALFSFPICSVRSHAKRLFNARTEKCVWGERDNGICWCETHKSWKCWIGLAPEPVADNSGVVRGDWGQYYHLADPVAPGFVNDPDYQTDELLAAEPVAPPAGEKWKERICPECGLTDFHTTTCSQYRPPVPPPWDVDVRKMIERLERLVEDGTPNPVGKDAIAMLRSLTDEIASLRAKLASEKECVEELLAFAGKDREQMIVLREALLTYVEWRRNYLAGGKAQIGSTIEEKTIFDKALMALKFK
jgi:hypothetical protein